MKKIVINPGDVVICDACGEDFTENEVHGGFLFLSWAVCPMCAERFEKNIIENNEQRFIKKRCPQNMSFADFVRNLCRG